MYNIILELYHDIVVSPHLRIQDSTPPTKGEGPGQAIAPAIPSLAAKRGVASWPSAI